MCVTVRVGEWGGGGVNQVGPVHLVTRDPSL